jgi:hypothetical protein
VRRRPSRPPGSAAVPIGTSRRCSIGWIEGGRRILHFLVTRGYDTTLAFWLASPRSGELRDRIRIRFDEDIGARDSMEAGTWIFGDLERLGPAGRELAVGLHDALLGSGAPVRLLNDPATALDRLPLLSALHAAGVNPFRAFRAGDPLPLDLAFPVFVRMERQHGGSLTPLLPDRSALEQALRRLVAPMRGYRLRDLLVVEFHDVSDGEGMFNKHTAFGIGDRVVPQHADFSRNWTVKARRRHYDERTIRADFEYVRGNPHAEPLSEVFRIAGIGYGRADYAVRGDDLVVWEINTNRVIGPSGPPGRIRAVPAEHRAATQPSRDLFDVGLRSALQAVDVDGRGEQVELRLPARLVARARLERQDYLWRTRFRRGIKGVGMARARLAG